MFEKFERRTVMKKKFFSTSIRAFVTALLLLCEIIAIPAVTTVKAEDPALTATPANLVSKIPTDDTEPFLVIKEIPSPTDTQPAAQETSAPAATAPAEAITPEPAQPEETPTAPEPAQPEIEEKPAEPTPAATCSYCGGSGHSSTYCGQKAVDNGATGRWIIPGVGINVACYQPSTSYGQDIADAWDSAAYFGYAGLDIVCDHSNQEFSALKYVYVGMEAYMDYGSYRQKYVCTRFEYGHNDGTYLMDADYNQIYPVYSDYNTGGITCYTCNGNWQNIILVSFQPVSD